MFAVLLLAAPALAETRVALVVGNSSYTHAGRLTNPQNDAQDMARELKSLGFQVTTGFDLDEHDFASILADFALSLRNADVALFYYAGHGLQFDGQNFLIPVDARLENQFSVRREAIALDEILNQMTLARISLAFIDACRNNPLSEELKRSLALTGRSTAVGSGLAPMEITGSDMLVAFAAAAGAVAEDGTGRNSPFTAAVLKHLDTPGVEISTVLKRITADVREETRGRQQPEQLASMATEFYMVPAGTSVTDSGPAAVPATVPATQSGGSKQVGNRKNASLNVVDDVVEFEEEEEPVEAPAETAGGRERLAIYEGLDFYGEDISSSRVDDIVACALECLERSCAVFTFNANPRLRSGPNCFAKQSIGRLEAYRDAISGLFLSPGEDTPDFSFEAIDPLVDVLSDTGLTGPNILTATSLQMRSPGTCRTGCLEQAQCAAFTYTSATKRCQWKAEAGAAVPASGQVSGIKRRVSMPASDVISLEE